jgi:hypothetical protein
VRPAPVRRSVGPVFPVLPLVAHLPGPPRSVKSVRPKNRPVPCGLCRIRGVHHYHVFPPHPWRVRCRCHRAVWTAPRTTKSADTGAAECEATAASGLADNAVDAETTCLAMHIRAVDLGRVVAEAALREQSTATGPNARIRAEVGVSRSAPTPSDGTPSARRVT